MSKKADGKIHVAVSGGAERASFVYKGQKYSQNEMVAFLQSQVRPDVIVQKRATRQTKIIVVPDSVDGPSKTKVMHASNGGARGMHVVEFLRKYRAKGGRAIAITIVRMDVVRVSSKKSKSKKASKKKTASKKKKTSKKAASKKAKKARSKKRA